MYEENIKTIKHYVSFYQTVFIESCSQGTYLIKINKKGNDKL